MVGLVAKYQRYDDYKESGVEWLGRLPSHWQFKRHKYIANFAKGKNPDLLLDNLTDGLYPYLSMDSLRGKSESKFAEYKKGLILAEDNQPLIIWDGSNAGEFVLGKKGILSSTMSAASLIYPLDSRFYWYACVCIEPDMRKHATGMGIPHVNGEELRGIFLPIPYLKEQTQIAHFLDHETAKIDSLIEKQQQLIQLLKEKRQAVISHAVTKGLDPSVKMKDSGVEWLGEVPEHWEKKILKYIVSHQGGGTPDKGNLSFWGGDIPWVSPKDMKVDYISTSQDKITVKAIEQSSTQLIPIGSVLMVVRGMILIHSVPVALTQEAVTINQDMKALIPNKLLDSEYFLYLLKGLKDYLLDYVETSGHGTKCLRSDDFMNMPLFLPKVDEQINIVEYIKNKSKFFDSLIYKAESAIQLMQERRTALISAAVTGKIDVRDWQSPNDAKMEFSA